MRSSEPRPSGHRGSLSPSKLYGAAVSVGHWRRAYVPILPPARAQIRTISYRPPQKVAPKNRAALEFGERAQAMVAIRVAMLTVRTGGVTWRT